MNELDPELQSLVDACRGGDDPTGSNVCQNRSALARRLGAGAFAAAIAASGTTAAAGGAASTAGSLVLKSVAVVALCAGVAGAFHFASRRPAPATLQATGATVNSPPMTVIAPEPLLSPPLDRQAVLAEAPHTFPSGTRAKSPPAKVAAPMEAVSVPTTAAPSSNTLAAELPLLRQAQSSLRDGDARHALALLDRHRAEFPKGTLAEERRALTVVTICTLGRSDAAATARQFLADRPHSPLAVRIREVCKL